MPSASLASETIIPSASFSTSTFIPSVVFKVVEDSRTFSSSPIGAPTITVPSVKVALLLAELSVAISNSLSVVSSSKSKLTPLTLISPPALTSAANPVFKIASPAEVTVTSDASWLLLSFVRS